MSISRRGLFFCRILSELIGRMALFPAHQFVDHVLQLLPGAALFRPLTEGLPLLRKHGVIDAQRLSVGGYGPLKGRGYAVGTAVVFHFITRVKYSPNRGHYTLYNDNDAPSAAPSRHCDAPPPEISTVYDVFSPSQVMFEEKTNFFASLALPACILHFIGL